MHFELVKKKDVSLLKKWFQQDYISKYWYGEGLKNTYETIEKFTNQESSIYTLWMAYDKDVAFGYLMTSKVTKEDVLYMKHLPEGKKAITLDVLIGNTDYLGKGLSHIMIQRFLLEKYSDVDFVFIDPSLNNSKAIHVYKKAGFQPVVEFKPSWDPTVSHLLMSLSLESIFNLKHE